MIRNNLKLYKYLYTLISLTIIFSLLTGWISITFHNFHEEHIWCNEHQQMEHKHESMNTYKLVNSNQFLSKKNKIGILSSEVNVKNQINHLECLFLNYITTREFNLIIKSKIIHFFISCELFNKIKKFFYILLQIFAFAPKNSPPAVYLTSTIK